jgi:hypothetical protein
MCAEAKAVFAFNTESKFVPVAIGRWIRRGKQFVVKYII